MDLDQLGRDEIGIRMYKAGFGDCFLVSLPGSDRRRKLLVDCGSIASHKKSMGEIVGRVIVDAGIGEADGRPRIDVVVCTHRHRDHVAGFAKPAWKEVEVGEVWMPWTEDPTDSEARRILHAQASLAFGLTARFADANFTGGEIARLTRAALDDRTETADALVHLGRQDEKDSKTIRQSIIALNALSNPEAMETLHSGFSGSPKRYFLPEKGTGPDSRNRTFTTPLLPGVDIHVMGPSRDEETIRLMDPPDGKSYFRAAPLQADKEEGRPPFGAEWRVAKADEAQVAGSFRMRLKAADLKRLEQLDSEDPDLLAASLDGAVNGTSLMFMLSYRGMNLLFPGDAQWGTWKRALADPQWRDLMARTGFYKVGHHGSHNATPKEFVEELIPGDGRCVAMVSVTGHGRWPEIPRAPLMRALAEHSRTVRADADPATIAAPFSEGGDMFVDTILPI